MDKRFELTIQLRDHQGKLTGKTKTITTDNADELDTFWSQNNTQNDSRRNKNRRTNKGSGEGIKSPE